MVISPEKRRLRGLRAGTLAVLGAALAAGSIAFAVTFIRNTGKTLPAKDVSATSPDAKLPSGAEVVAKRFIRATVAREGLRDANALAYQLKLDYAGPKESVMTVAFTPRAGGDTEPQIFYLTLVKVGPQGNERWVVDAWVPRRTIRASVGG
jgi:hypothetical protein